MSVSKFNNEGYYDPVVYAQQRANLRSGGR